MSAILAKAGKYSRVNRGTGSSLERIDQYTCVCIHGDPLPYELFEE